MKKYNNKANVVGELIKKYREQMKLSKPELCRRLQLHAVYMDHAELYRIEQGEKILRDFELLAICKELHIDYKELKNMVD